MDEVSHSEVLMPAGHDGIVYRNSDNTCTKVWTNWTAQKEEDVCTVRRVLQHSGIPTFQRFDIDPKTKQITMEDLSNRGKNLVVSETDFFRFSSDAKHLEETQEVKDGTKLWTTAARSRVISNPDEFLKEATDIFHKALKNNLRLMYTTYFLVVTPEGNARTVVGDMDDVAMERDNVATIRPQLDNHDIRQYAGYLANYLQTVVCAFFPAMREKVILSLSQLEQQYGINLSGHKSMFRSI